MRAPYEVGNPPGRDALLEALALTPPRLDLAALAIARLGDASLDINASLTKLDRLAERVAARIDELGAVDALVSVLGVDEGFEGDRVIYDLPENSFLNQVLERRRGLPIVLSVVYLEVGRRAGLSAHGVALPGHFVVMLDEVVIDPFDGGARLTLTDCERIVRKASSLDIAQLTAAMLEPTAPRAIVLRMLNNLKSAWLQRSETEAALCAVDMVLALLPNQPSDLRLRAGLLMELGAFRAALNDIETCLREPTPPDLRSLEKTAQNLRDRIGQLH